MASILRGGEIFDEISPSSLYEKEFEEILTQNAPALFPGYIFIPFKVEVATEDARAKPDFVLLEEELRGWWIGEVELGNHGLKSHVLPQISILSRAYYGTSEVERLYEHADLPWDRDRLADLAKGTQPRVLVIVNTPKPNWIEPLRRHDASLCVVEIFRSEKNEHVLRLDGERPTRPSSMVSKARMNSLLGTMLEIANPAGLGVEPGEKVVIEIDGARTEWKRWSA